MVDWFAVAGFVLGNMVAGVIGNRTDVLFCQCWQTIYERLRQGSPRDNHHLQRAIRKAVLQATLCLLSDALTERGVNVQNLISRLWRRLPFGQLKDEESRWLWRVYNELSAELGRVSSAEDVPPSPVAENELALLLQPQGVTAEERAKELQKRLTDKWLNELRERFDELPEVFVRRLREGWQPPKATERVFWFDLVCAFFAHEVKHNQAVANIVMAKLLANLKVDEQPLRDALTDYLEQKFAPILQRLDDIKQQLDELGRQQREGFEELKERQAEIIATLMPMRETQQVMQALLSEVVKWLRWMTENFGKSHVATYLDDATRQFLREKWQQGFVGRKEAMERLNRFVATNPNGVAIVYAPAGYGKTTFLAHWIRQVEETGGWLSGDGETVVAIVRHFFSPTMHLSPSPSNACAHLLAQLTRLSDQPTPIPDRDDERWAALRNFLANLKLPDSVNKLVIVLDGLDDAEGEVEPFDKIPEGLFVVVSGRWDGEGELPNYLKKWARFTEFIPLKALSEEELREWLRTAGEGELAQFAENDDFVRMLREKTDGFPLFVRYLMDDLLQAVKEGKSPEQVLERTPKGFSEYVKEQLDELERSEELEQRVGSKIWDLFALLTVTKGALRQDEVEALTGFSRRELKRLRHQVTRWFSIGKTRSPADIPTADMATYSFAHPLLAEEFRKYLGKEAKQMEERLLKWCENWREHWSFPYILRHYADHLYDKWRMTNEQMTYDALCQLALDSDFKQAQTQHLPDEPNLPLKTVQLALDAAIQLEDAPMMARLLMEHAKRAQSEETPLQAWRRGHRDRALELATDIVFKRDHKLGTLWSLLLAWVAESEGERDWAKRFLDEVRKRWEGAKLTELDGWQGEMAAFLLGKLGQVEGAIEVAGLVLGDVSKRELAASLASKELFDQALKVAEGIEEAEKQARALAVIAKGMGKAGIVEQAKEVFDCALKVAKGIEDARRRAETLGTIAGEMVKAGMPEWAKEVFDRALKVAKEIEGAKKRSRALGAIAGEMAKAGMFDQALKVAEGIEDAWERAKALAAIAGEMAKAGMEERAKEVFKQALKVAEEVEDAWERARALAAIAEGMGQAGIFDQALKVAEGIEDAWERAKALAAIAGEMAKAGMEERAKEVFKQALKVAEEVEDARWRAEALGAIAGEMAKAGMFDQALKVAEGIEEADERAWALMEIAVEMTKAGMVERAREVFEQALKVAERIKVAWERAEALSAVAGETTEAGMLYQALYIGKETLARALGKIAGEMAKAGMFDQALKVAEGIEGARERAEALREIAEEMAKAGMFDQALKVAKGIEEADERARALMEIAGEMTKAGVQDEALWRDALKVAKGIEGARERAEALGEIAEEMAKAGMKDWAKEVFDQALKVAEGIEKEWERARALMEIAGEMTKAGVQDEALWRDALKVAEGIEGARERAEALGEIAGGMAKAGMFDQALKVAEGIEGARERAEALREIAEEMAKAGMKDWAKEVFDQALKVAEGIEGARERAWALGKIAGGMAKAGVQDEALWRDALKVAKGIEGARERAEALGEIAEEMAKAGMKDWAKEVFDQALKVAEGIEKEWERAEALGKIAGEMAKAGMFDQALKVAEGIEGARERAWALREIAGGMAKAGVQDEALWRDALKVAEGIEGARERAEALGEIAEEMAKAGMKDWAKEVFDQALKVAEGIEIEKEWERAWALREIAGGMAKAGVQDEALWRDALKVAEGIEGARERAWALREIAEEMAKAGMKDWAKEVFDQALKVAEGIEGARERAEALREIAEEMAKAGMKDWAKEVFDQALKVAEGIEGARERAWALREIAEEMAKAGMKDWAKEVFDQALKVAEGIEGARERAWALGKIAGGMAKAGMFDQALKVAERIEGARERAEALREIAEEMAKAGMTDWERARSLITIAGEMAKAGMFDQALKVAERIGDARWRAWALIAIAEEMAKAGEVERAVGIVEREMAVRTEGLPFILSALAVRAKQGDGKSKEGVLKLLPLCGWSLEFAYPACRLLAWLYPERGEEIVRVVSGE